ncbi:MAG: hypothetical protein BGO88_17015 [Flavobacterium sp. 38-13]|uniref:hypothetical protein n=1 Tax=Flavobacterium sp. 38-13 TaxID=1896168 RepID=UPI00096096C2|nr:hypothetical protein [Flavobacterium sp. 38-13]OJX52252.1 MAG: hypothetical protein BGO88_17015 [Flavobacterium sp. 38-13]
MDLIGITLESLLTNPLIKKVTVGGKWYFSKEALNIIYDDNFKYVDSKLVKIKENGFYSVKEYIGWEDISEHIEHIRQAPGFDDRLREMFD